MHSLFGPALRLGIGRDGIALLRGPRWGRAPLQLVAGQPLPEGAIGRPELLAGAIGELLREAGRKQLPLSVVLADDLVRLWLVSPPEGSGRLADLQAAAALRFQRLFGEAAANWLVSAAWDARRPFLAAAMQRSLREALQQGAAGHRHPLVEIVPQFVAMFNRWGGALAPDAWFGVVHERVLTLAARSRAGLAAVRVAALPANADAAWLATHLAREALRLDLAAPARLQLCGAVPPAWLGASAALACSQVERSARPDWPHAAQLAASGSRA
jgi:hypothetical protein